MEEGKVTILQVGGVSLIGVLQTAGAPVQEGFKILKNPRVVRVIPVNNTDINIVFQVLVGNPSYINIYNILFDYPAGQMLEHAYLENVTGLTLAKTMPPVVKLAGHKPS